MKKPFLRVIAGLFILIAVFLIYTSFKHNQQFKFKVTAEDMHLKLLSDSHQVTPAEAQKLLKSDEYVFVDLSNPRQYEYFHIAGSYNVPFETVLDDAYKSLLKESKKKVLVSETGIRAEEIWNLLTQYGYNNLYVLEGGRTYWREYIASGKLFKEKGIYEDEKAKFDYKGLTSKKDTARKEEKK